MKIETCFICKLGIDIKKDDFCEISDYRKGKHFKSIYCHPDCWKEKMSDKKMMREALGHAIQITKKTERMMT